MTDDAKSPGQDMCESFYFARDGFCHPYKYVNESVIWDSLASIIVNKDQRITELEAANARKSERIEELVELCERNENMICSNMKTYGRCED